MGVSLQHISEQTRIGVRYLEALEAGDFKQLPGAIFARSFVRQYAELVGTDVSSLESELQQTFPLRRYGPSRGLKSWHAKGHSPDQYAARRRRSRVAAACRSRRISLATALVSRRSFTWAGSASSFTMRRASRRRRSKFQPSLRSARGLVRQSPAVVPAAVRHARTRSSQKPSTELQAPRQRRTGRDGMRVVASEKTWVSIVANGRFLYSGILQPYEERTVTGVEYARLVVGNSTGVDVQTDGHSIGPDRSARQRARGGAHRRQCAADHAEDRRPSSPIEPEDGTKLD